MRALGFLAVNEFRFDVSTVEICIELRNSELRRRSRWAGNRWTHKRSQKNNFTTLSNKDHASLVCINAFIARSIRSMPFLSVSCSRLTVVKESVRAISFIPTSLSFNNCSKRFQTVRAFCTLAWVMSRAKVWTSSRQRVSHLLISLVRVRPSTF